VTSGKKLATDKHSSLFSLCTSAEEKSLVTLIQGDGGIQPNSGAAVAGASEKKKPKDMNLREELINTTESVIGKGRANITIQQDIEYTIT
jgi:hypothetical protein